MPLNSKTILEIARMDLAKAGTRGALMHHQRTLRHERGLLAAQQLRMIEALLEIPRRDPSKAAAKPASVTGVKPGPFAPSTILWLQRLPTDVSAMTLDDYDQLRRLEAQTARTDVMGQKVDNPSRDEDARLIRSIIAPVRARFERERLDSELANVKAAKPVDVPPVVSEMLAVTLRAENALIDEREAGYIASTRLATAIEERDSAYAAHVRDVESQIESIDLTGSAA